jgi:multiple sugar transport system substrate-binding protein
MKKLFSLTLAALMTAGALTACSGNSGTDTPATTPSSNETTASANETTPTQEKVTIKLEQFSANGESGTEDALKEMISKFNEVEPNITVELQSFGYDDYFTQLQAKIVGGNAADLFELNFENFVSYASEGVLADIGGYLGDTSGFNQTALNAFNYKGTQYGVPNSFSNVVLVYNKALFDQAGVAYPTDAWTWTDMLDAAKKIRALGNGYWGLYRPTSFFEFFKGAKQNGGSVLSDDGKSFTMNTPQNVETLETMAGWVSDSNVMPSEAQMGGMGDWDLFQSGRLGMIVTGIWSFSTFTDNCNFDWDIAVEPGNTAKATHFFSNGYVVNKEGQNTEAAAKLAAFLAGSKDATAIRVAASWELPPVTYTDVLDSYLEITPPANRQAVFDSLNYLATVPVVRQQSEMQEIIEKYLGNVVSGIQSAKDALDACQKELEEKITLD